MGVDLNLQMFVCGGFLDIDIVHVPPSREMLSKNTILSFDQLQAMK